MDKNKTMPKPSQKGFQPTYAELEKELKAKETKFEREREQFRGHIEILEMKVKDAQEREANAERLHNIMLEAFKNDQSTHNQANFVQEYEKLTEMHKTELKEAVKGMKEMEKQVSNLKSKNTKLKETVENLKGSCDSMQKEINRLLVENTKLEKENLVLQK